MNFREFAQSKQTVIHLELERVRMLLEMAGNPDKKVRIIHVAGTNGKGSVCSFISCGLMFMGHRTGKFSSPEMFDVTDTITIDGNCIDKEELYRIYDVLLPYCETIKKETGVLPSQFEINFVAALLHFVNNDCEYVILECGLGGKGDATNAVSDSIISIITKISIDHISFLGNTISEIADAKCGIFKDSSLVITGFQTSEAMDVIRQKASGRKMIEAGCPEHTGFDGFNEVFSYGRHKNLKCSLCGVHQVQNAALAIEALEFIGADDEAIRYAVSNAKNQARFEKLSDGVYFDGGHNPDGIKSLISSINRYCVSGKIIFILGFMADKDISSVIDSFADLKCSDFEFYTCRVHSNPRSASGEDVADIIKSKGYRATVFECVNDACRHAYGKCDTLIIAGSLYMYKECTFFGGDKYDEN